MKLDKPSQSHGRQIDAGALRFAIVGKNRSVLYAARWLRMVGATLQGAKDLDAATRLPDRPLAVLVAGDSVMASPDPAEQDDGPTLIRVWDYEVGRAGVGAFASAVSGVSTVIGAEDGPPGVMPAHIPEKWAGMYAAGLALSLQFARAAGKPLPRTMDVSAADILRAFAEQNSGNHAGVPYGWRRNGRTAVEHGGVFPQGFFPCRDGHLAIQARSRQDWQGILDALGNPEWSHRKEFQNPFTLSHDDSRISQLLVDELRSRDRKEWLDRALKSGGPMAPVFSLEEAMEADVFRAGFMDPDGSVAAPFIVNRLNA